MSNYNISASTKPDSLIFKSCIINSRHPVLCSRFFFSFSPTVPLDLGECYIKCVHWRVSNQVISSIYKNWILKVILIISLNRSTLGNDRGRSCPSVPPPSWVWGQAGKFCYFLNEIQFCKTGYYFLKYDTLCITLSSWCGSGRRGRSGSALPQPCRTLSAENTGKRLPQFPSASKPHLSIQRAGVQARMSLYQRAGRAKNNKVKSKFQTFFIIIIYLFESAI